MKIHMMEQKSKEWLEVRRGKMTASNAQPIGNVGKGLDSYIIEVMADYYSSGTDDNFVTFDMKKGIEREPFAREQYELETGTKVTEVGFIEYNEYVGASPDGLVGEDGGVEFKCLKDINHFKFLLNGESEMDTKYIWQIQMNLLITGRKWWDYVMYSPNFEDNIIIFRIYPDEEKHNKLLAGFEYGQQKIEEIKSKIGKEKQPKIEQKIENKEEELF